MIPEIVDIDTTDKINATISCFLKIDFIRTTSGRLAPAELINIAMTGPNAIPFIIRI